MTGEWVIAEPAARCPLCGSIARVNNDQFGVPTVRACAHYAGIGTIDRHMAVIFTAKETDGRTNEKNEPAQKAGANG